MIHVKTAAAPAGTVAGFLREDGTGSVTSLDSKLFAWQRLQMQCDAARTRLKEAMGSPRGADAKEFDGDPAIAALHADVQRLQDEMAALLAEIHALRRQRAAPGSQER